MKKTICYISMQDRIKFNNCIAEKCGSDFFNCRECEFYTDIIKYLKLMNL